HRAVHPWPLFDPGNQAFLDAVAEDISEPRDLHLLFVADHDRLIPPAPDLLLPSGPAADLLGQVRVEVAHEVAELLRVVHSQEAMPVVRSEHVTYDFDRVFALSASEDAEDDVVELRGGRQQQTPLDGPAGHLHEGPAVWDEAQMATHAQYQSENGSRFFHSTSNFFQLLPGSSFSRPRVPQRPLDSRGTSWGTSWGAMSHAGSGGENRQAAARTLVRANAGAAGVDGFRFEDIEAYGVVGGGSMSGDGKRSQGRD